MGAAHCLIIEGDPCQEGGAVGQALGPDRGFACQVVQWSSLTPELLAHTSADLVVTLAVPDPTPALRLFHWLAGHPVPRPVFAVLPGQAEEAVLESAARAVDDFVMVPVREMELRHRLARLLVAPAGDDTSSLHLRLSVALGLGNLVGSDPAFLRTIAQLPRIAISDMPVLIVGETGTGKELCARALHHLSKRRDRPFVAVDCGSVPEHLFENELFGHARGAFTDAHRDQRGLVALAEGGTLFLDEVDSLSAANQAKLLRFLQERSYRPLGADRLERADINVVAASNRDLEACVREQRFRSDLYYRLNVLRLQLPPLRQRRGDIPRLARLFLEEARGSNPEGPRSFSAAALCALAQHEWPGNVRELQNVVRRAVVASQSAQILVADLSLSGTVEEAPAVPSGFRAARQAAVEGFERRYVEDLLRRHGGNVTRAAREAHKDRRAFGRLIKKYSIDKRVHD